MYLNKAKLIVKLLLLLLVNQLCFAMPDDRKQIVHLSANSADIDQLNHRGTYTGNVEFDQGTTHLRAAEAMTEGNEKNQLVKAIIKGSQLAQAHYWEQTDVHKPLVHAFADTIYYYPDRHLIELIGHARVEQGKDSFSAPQISYDTLHQHVLSKNDKETRTTIIIHPETKP